MVDIPAIQPRLRMMWDRDEDSLAELLAAEAGASRHDPAPRLAAAQVIPVFRLLGSDDLRASIGSQPPAGRRGAMQAWLESS